MMQTERLDITDMSCGGCSRKVTEALKAVRGVDAVDVSLEDKQATVRFDAKLTSVGQLEAAVRGAGYDVIAGDVAHTAKARGCCCG